jgi:hypothetical protein
MISLHMRGSSVVYKRKTKQRDEEGFHYRADGIQFNDLKNKYYVEREISLEFNINCTELSGRNSFAIMNINEYLMFNHVKDDII